MDLEISLQCKIRERDGRFKLEFTEEDRLLIQDCLKFHKFRGGVIQFSLGHPDKKRTIRMNTQKNSIEDNSPPLERWKPLDTIKKMFRPRDLAMDWIIDLRE